MEDFQDANSESDVSLCLFGSQPLSQDPEGAVKSATSTPRLNRKRPEPAKPVFPDPDLSAIEENGELEKSDPSDTALIEEVLNEDQDSKKSENTLGASKPLSEISNRSPGSPLKNSTRISKSGSESPGAPLKNSTRIENSSTAPTQKLNKFAKYKFVIVVSQISREEKCEVQKLAVREGGIVLNSFNEFCTHVITSYQIMPDRSRTAARSLKLIQGTFNTYRFDKFNT